MSAEVRLGLDAATDRLSVAVARPGEEPTEVSLLGARRHASALPGLASDLLGMVGAAIGDVGLVALADGPGGFTGLRVGAAFVKAFAVGRPVRVVTAPSLLLRAAGAAGPGERVLAMSPAMRGEIFVGIWVLGADRVETILAPRVLEAEEVPGLPDVDRVVGRAPTAVTAAMHARYGQDRIVPGESWPSAGELLRLVNRTGAIVAVDDIARWEPVYGRLAEAQTRWEQAHGQPLPDPHGPTG